METKFDGWPGKIGMSHKRCPYCGAWCYQNIYGEWICPNCGIVAGNQRLFKPGVHDHFE